MTRHYASWFIKYICFEDLSSVCCSFVLSERHDVSRANSHRSCRGRSEGRWTHWRHSNIDARSRLLDEGRHLALRQVRCRALHHEAMVFVWQAAQAVSAGADGETALFRSSWGDQPCWTMAWSLGPWTGLDPGGLGPLPIFQGLS